MGSECLQLDPLSFPPVLESAVLRSHFSFPGQSQLLALCRTSLALGDDV